jgi:hypothetical protein
MAFASVSFPVSNLCLSLTVSLIRSVMLLWLRQLPIHLSSSAHTHEAQLFLTEV